MHSGGSGAGGFPAPPFTLRHPVQTLPLICTPAPAWPAPASCLASCCTVYASSVPVFCLRCVACTRRRWPESAALSSAAVRGLSAAC